MDEDQPDVAAEVRITPARGVEQGIVERIRELGPILAMWTRRELRVRYRQSYLRAAWAFLQPALILATYGLVLTQVLDVGSDGAPYLTFAWAGLVPVTFFQQSLGLGVGSIQQAGGLISRVQMPREVLPLAVIGTAAVDAAAMGVILVVVSTIQVGLPGLHVVGVLAAIVTLVLWTVGLTLAASAATVFRRDLNHAVPLFLRVLFIVTPVMYPASLLGGWVDLNPLAVVAESVRNGVYRDRWPGAVLAVHAAVGVFVAAGGFALFRKLEPRMGDAV